MDVSVSDQPDERSSNEAFTRAIWPDPALAPSRTVRCRHCGQHNRVVVSAAVMTPERHRCGRCGSALFLATHEPLTRIASEAYQHSLDRRSLAALQSIPGFPRVIRWVLESIGDRSAQMLFMADAILCSDEQFPELIAMVDLARSRLDIPYRPSVYLGESPHMNALTTGVREPTLVVRSALLDQMGDTELIAILGHELGHLHAGHPLYQSVARALLAGSATASPAIRVFGFAFERVLLRWTRCAELTADRAALLACRDLRACISMMLTFAGGNRPGTAGRTQMRLTPFIRQCRELAALQANSSLDGVLGGYLTMDRTHPNLAARVIHLIQWVEHGNYLQILSGNYARRGARLSRRSRRRAPPQALHEE